MRGASRASLAEAKGRLAALAAQPDRPAGLSEDLFAIVALLDAQPPLRRALADSSRGRGARASLVASLLTGKVGERAIELVSAVVTSPWSAPADLVDALEQLAVLTVVIEADRAGRLDDLEDDLFRFGRVLGTEAELRAALGNPFAPADAKRALVDSLLAGRASPQTVELVTQAALAPRGRSLDRTLEEYARLAAEQRERLVAEVRVAIELSAARRSRLAAALRGAYGHDVHLNVVLDPQVMGGMIIRVAGEQIDGSVASRLAEARRGLTA
ncbi:MAG: F0F1 ATP synthase subunit delta [Streptosporangiaceae bacterium]